MQPPEFLQKLVEIYSPSGREDEVAHFVTEVARQKGFVRAEVDHFNNAICEIGAGERTVLLLGHLDTVKPFLPVRVKNKTLYGRGVVDAKGSFTAFFYAALAAAQKVKKLKIIVVGAAGEESQGVGARVFVERIKRPAAVIIGEPSGLNGVTLGYKGVFSLEFFRRKKAFHSAKANEQNVIEEGIAFTERVREFGQAFNEGKSAWTGLQHRVEKFVFDTVGGVEQIKIRLRFRTPLNFDFSLLKKLVTRHASKAEVSYLQSWGSEAACLAAKNTVLVRAFLAVLRAEGLTPRFAVKTGTADMNTVCKAFPGVPIVAYGPGDSALDHTPHERLPFKELTQAIKVLRQVLERLEGG